MPDTAGATTERQPDAGLITYAHIIYALHASAVLTGVLTSSSIAGRFLFGVPSLIAVIMNYARRAEAHGTWLETHFDWQIRTFWRALLWIAITLLVGGLLTLIVIGIFIVIAGFCVVGLWVAYRVIRGWIALREHRAMPRPTGTQAAGP
ncbi:MAG TPA: hypothetical protein VK130_06270 [Steroidobacteraceae bacterium]|nr:hypothetical protein [Steroidobacteraceae bacterium]